MWPFAKKPTQPETPLIPPTIEIITPHLRWKDGVLQQFWAVCRRPVYHLEVPAIQLRLPSDENRRWYNIPKESSS